MTLNQVSIFFLGSGDAFGNGGRFNTCFCLNTPGGRFLIDCGASSLVSMKQYNVGTDSIDGILISHYHGDHFAGVPFLLIEGKVNGRQRPLIVAGFGPIEERTRQWVDTLLPGVNIDELGFPVQFISLQDHVPKTIGPLQVTVFPVVHSPLTLPHGIRIETNGKVISYSGDTEWTEELINIAEGADLFICECLNFSGQIKNHLTFETLSENRHLLRTDRVILTHMGPDMLSQVQQTGWEYAEDGKETQV